MKLTSARLRSWLHLRSSIALLTLNSSARNFVRNSRPALFSCDELVQLRKDKLLIGEALVREMRRGQRAALPVDVDVRVAPNLVGTVADSQNRRDSSAILWNLSSDQGWDSP